MRDLDKIRAEYTVELDKAASTGKEAKARDLRAELVNALTKGLSTDRVEAILMAEKAGRVLPLGIGDKVYMNDPCGDWYEGNITGYREGVCEPLTYVYVYGDGAMSEFEADEIGKTVFFTPEAAAASRDVQP